MERSLMRILTIFLIMVMLSGGVTFVAAQAMKASFVVFQLTVIDGETGRPLPFATVEIESRSYRVYTNEAGVALVRLQKDDKVEVKVTFVGMEPVRTEIEVGGSNTKRITLHPSTLSLEGVEVVASSSTASPGKTVIGRTALEYLQPTSLADVMTLTPGGLVRLPGLNSVQQITMRETRPSANSALGTAILLDGIPLSNDANLLGMGNNNQQLRSYITMNRGIDLRTLSVDHVEEISVEQGIPSVRYGNLTSGFVSMKTRVGATPWDVRLQADPYTKLMSVGKGFTVADRHAVYIGSDLAANIGSLINPIDTYRRWTGVMRYRFIGSRENAVRANLSYHLSLGLDHMKFDPETMVAKEVFEKSAQMHMLSGDLSIEPTPESWRLVELQASLNYTSDQVHQERYIQAISTLVQPLAREDGAYEGVYLKPIYFSIFDTDSRPFNVFVQARSQHQWGMEWSNGHSLSLDLMWGGEWSMDKNVGRGTLYDPTLPPNPGSPLSSRPVAYRDIPGTSVVSAFLEGHLHFPTLYGIAPSVRIGLRSSYDLQLAKSDYAMARRLPIEPRILTTFSLPDLTIGRDKLKVSLMAGFGRLVKRPTVAYLYPNKAYFDFVEANYYTEKPEHRLLWVRTYVRDRQNYELASSEEKKWEGGLQLDYGATSITLNLFRHTLLSGYENFSRMIYTPFNRYSYEGTLAPGKPTLDLFASERIDRTSALTTPTNSVKEIKQGVEYVVRLPRMRPLYTRLMIQGAWFKTIYGNSIATPYAPSRVVDGKAFPYVGYYTGRNDIETSRLHTLLRSDTQLPHWALIFTSQLQMIWYERYRDLPYDPMPRYWIDEKGKQHDALDLNDDLQKQLFIPVPDYIFDTNRKSLSLSWHLKMTKEINRKVKLSIFVNNLVTYDPVYKSNLKTEHQAWKKPFFGSELRVSF